MTPLLFAALAHAGVARARHGAHAASRATSRCSAGWWSLGFFVLGFFADTERVSFHWPLPGYLALLPLLPACWRAGRARCASRDVGARRRLGLLAMLGYYVAVSQPGRARAQSPRRSGIRPTSPAGTRWPTRCATQRERCRRARASSPTTSRSAPNSASRWAIRDIRGARPSAQPQARPRAAAAAVGAAARRSRRLGDAPDAAGRRRHRGVATSTCSRATTRCAAWSARCRRRRCSTSTTAASASLLFALDAKPRRATARRRRWRGSTRRVGGARVGRDVRSARLGVQGWRRPGARRSLARRPRDRAWRDYGREYPDVQQCLAGSPTIRSTRASDSTRRSTCAGAWRAGRALAGPAPARARRQRRGLVRAADRDRAMKYAAPVRRRRAQGKREARFAQQPRGRDQRQPDQRRRVLRFDRLEQGDAQAFRLEAAGAVERLFGVDVALDLVARQRAETHRGRVAAHRARVAARARRRAVRKTHGAAGHRAAVARSPRRGRRACPAARRRVRRPGPSRSPRRPDARAATAAALARGQALRPGPRGIRRAAGVSSTSGRAVSKGRPQPRQQFAPVARGRGQDQPRHGSGASGQRRAGALDLVELRPRSGRGRRRSRPGPRPVAPAMASRPWCCSHRRWRSISRMASPTGSWPRRRRRPRFRPGRCAGGPPGRRRRPAARGRRAGGGGRGAGRRRRSSRDHGARQQQGRRSREDPEEACAVCRRSVPVKQSSAAGLTRFRSPRPNPRRRQGLTV